MFKEFVQRFAIELIDAGMIAASLLVSAVLFYNWGFYMEFWQSWVIVAASYYGLYRAYGWYAAQHGWVAAEPLALFGTVAVTLPWEQKGEHTSAKA